MLVVNLKSPGLVSSCIIRSLPEIPVAICTQLLQHLGVSSEEKLHHCERGRVAFFLRILPLGRTGLGLNALRKCCIATFVLMRIVLVLVTLALRLSSCHGHPCPVVIQVNFDSQETSVYHVFSMTQYGLLLQFVQIYTIVFVF